MIHNLITKSTIIHLRQLNCVFCKVKYKFQQTRNLFLDYLQHYEPDLGQKWVKLAPNETNPGFFQIRFQYIFARRMQVFLVFSKIVLETSKEQK